MLLPLIMNMPPAGSAGIIITIARDAGSPREFSARPLMRASRATSNEKLMPDSSCPAFGETRCASARFGVPG